MKSYSGELGDLSPSQQKTFEIFKNYVKEKYTKDSKYDDYYLLRFCRARDFDLQKVSKMWDDFWKWRIDNKVDEIESYKVPHADEFKKLFPHGYYNVDKQGRPIYIERTGLINIKKLFELVDEPSLIKYFIQSYEKLQTIILPSCSKAKGRKIEKTLTIMDLKGLSITKVGKKIYDLLKTTSTIAQNNYPETLGSMLIINAPMLFSAVWAVAKTFVDEKTKAKIQILGGSYDKILKELVEIDKLPEFLGGKCKIPLEDCPGPWKEEWEQYGKPKQLNPVEVKPEELAPAPMELNIDVNINVPNLPDEEEKAEDNNIQISMNFSVPNTEVDESPNEIAHIKVNQTPLNTLINDDEQQIDQPKHNRLRKLKFTKKKHIYQQRN